MAVVLDKTYIPLATAHPDLLIELGQE
jgi:hypothetical protein